jgi:transcriptional regulator with XRE-family HTH domain
VKTIYTPRHLKLIGLLAEERKAAGLSQSALARKLNQYQSFIARIEGGQRGVDMVEFLAICEAIGRNVRPSTILREVQKAPPVALTGPQLRPPRRKK